MNNLLKVMLVVILCSFNQSAFSQVSEDGGIMFDVYTPAEKAEIEANPEIQAEANAKARAESEAKMKSDEQQQLQQEKEQNSAQQTQPQSNTNNNDNLDNQNYYNQYPYGGYYDGYGGYGGYGGYDGDDLDNRRALDNREADRAIRNRGDFRNGRRPAATPRGIGGEGRGGRR